MSKKFLKELKAGTAIVKMLCGGGYKTYEVCRIEEVNSAGIFMEGADGDYDNDSVYKYSLISGKSVNNFVPGFKSEIVRIATEEDLRKEQEDEEIVC